jgi:hypothetical protein
MEGKSDSGLIWNSLTCAFLPNDHGLQATNISLSSHCFEFRTFSLELPDSQEENCANGQHISVLTFCVELMGESGTRSCVQIVCEQLRVQIC